MKRIHLVFAAVLVATTTLSAQAVVIDAKFTGTVASQANAGFVLNSAVSGEFLYDTVAAKYLSFAIGGQTVAPGFASSAVMTPDLYSAFYSAQVSPVQTGGTFNSTFTLDLEALNTPWSSGAVALLTNTAQLTSDLDTSNSSFSFFTANADGSNAKSMSAMLNSLQVATVPEPATTALMLAGLLAIGYRSKKARR